MSHLFWRCSLKSFFCVLYKQNKPSCEGGVSGSVAKLISMVNCASSHMSGNVLTFFPIFARFQARRAIAASPSPIDDALRPSSAIDAFHNSAIACAGNRGYDTRVQAFAKAIHKSSPCSRATIKAMVLIMSLHQPVRTRTAEAGCPRSLRLVVRAETQQGRGAMQKARAAIRCVVGRSSFRQPEASIQ